MNDCIFEMDIDMKTNIDIDIPSNEMSIDTPKIEMKKEEDHSKLENLDYEHSGHTGFASKDDIIKDASNISFEDNFDYGVDNVQDALDEAFVALDAKLDNGVLDDLVSYSINQKKSDTQKATARKNISAKKDIIDLGIIDFADYNDDFDTFMNTLLNEGEYKFSDNDFTYYVKVVNLEKVVGQEYCTSEESYTMQYFRTVYLNDTGNFDYATDWDSIMTSAIANSAYAPKGHKHYKILEIASSIRTYLDSFNQYGKFSITSITDKEKYWVFTDYYNVSINGKAEYRRMQRYYSLSEPWKIYSRFRTI